MTTTDPAKILRDHAEGWLEASRNPGLDAKTRAHYQRMALEFARWAREMRKQNRK